MKLDSKLRFPSGTTVIQAKKNAKRLAKATDVKLHLALDEIAIKNGINHPWGEAINLLKKKSEYIEVLAEKLGSLEAHEKWLDILQDTSPGHYGVEDVDVFIGMNDISIDLSENTFTFEEASLSFSARLGGSSDRNGFDQNFTKTVSGYGEFSLPRDGEIVDLNVDDFSIRGDIDLYDEL